MKNQATDWLLRDKYRGVESVAFHADCARLEAGEPLAYVIGHVPFLDCTVYLDSHPLIPRPETEFWVEKAISEIMLQASVASRVLDLCAGSGAIGVAVAKIIPATQVTLVEIDPKHLLTIKKNCQYNLGITNTIKIVLGDLFSKLASEEKFDFILSNPPYIDATANTVEANVVAHEPTLALFGGEAGMELIAKIIADAPLYLTPVGQLWIEHEPFQTNAVTALAHRHQFQIVTHLDQYKTPRYSVLSMAQ